MSKTSVVVRSLIYNVVFYLNTALWCVIGLPTYLLPRWGVIWLAQSWAKSCIWWFEKICGVKVEFRGLDNILPGQPLIVASKHQSTFETLALLLPLQAPLYILKRELTWLPFFGWYLMKAEMIAIDRSSGKSALLNMTKQAREDIRSGRQLIIFPEGTRKAVGAPVSYKYGVSQIYAACDVPCVPVALNTGLFWPRRKFLRYPGTLVIEFLAPIPAGLPADDFHALMVEQIESASNRLIEAGRREQAQLLSFADTP